MTRLGTYIRRNFEPLLLSVQVLMDVAVLALAMLCAWWLREGISSPDTATPLIVYREVFSITAAVCLLCFHAFGLYSPIKSLLNVEEFKGIAKATLVSFFVIHALTVFLRGTTQEAEGIYGMLVPLHEAIDLDVNPEAYSRITIVLSFVMILAFITASRFISFRVIQRLHRRGIGNRNVLICGTGPTGRRLQRKFMLIPTLGLNLMGFATDKTEEVGSTIDRSRVLGTFEDLAYLLGELKISEVFIALPESKEEDVMGLLAELDRLGVPYHVVPRFYHLMTHRVRIQSLDSIPLISRMERRSGFLASAGKRLLDVLISLTVLTVGAAFFIVPMIMIKRESPGSAFFIQTRVGRNGKRFRMFKFRTMHENSSSAAPSPDSPFDPRVTRIGRFLRRYSLDELPNFINVLKGEMSLVGPRPEMPFIVDSYNSMQRERLRAKPGITGLWQISYARGEAIHENLDYDLYYIENQSLLLDMVIMTLTLFAVVKGSGAY
ncbi:MAG: sugar transferase [Planctomycetota bacterium]|jgi:exopolysaccharide biosynthesis polyprenyl glycosylphosphotransferase|nr:hypothetical protein [Planctomycetota bacterium]MDP6838509.1 sugar transferase [Planctomycetota bacterium]MDP6956476.1 sugar transferase [Planctomycetota bacterium]